MVLKHKPKQNGHAGDGLEIANSKSHAEFAVKCFTNYQDKLLIRITYEVAKFILSEPGLKGSADFKLKLVPTEGSQPIFLHSSLQPDDELGLKLIKGTYKGEPVSVVCMRQKHSASKIQKRAELLGKEPSISIKERGVDLHSLKKGLNAHLASNMDFGKKEVIDDICKILDSEEKGRNDLILLACGRDEEKARQVKAAFSAINKLTAEIAKIDAEMVKDSMQVDSRITVSKIVGSINDWPLCGKDLELFGQLPKSEMEHMCAWLKKYALEALPKTFGVEFLEYTATNAMDDFLKLLDIMEMENGGRESFQRKKKVFDNEIYALKGMIDKTDVEIKKMKSDIDLLQNMEFSDWFLRVCSLAGKRRDILARQLEIEAKTEKFSHENPNQKQMVLTLANMAANLCRVRQDELDRWKALYGNKEMQKFLSKSADGRAIRKKMASFMESSEKEISRIHGILSDVLTRREQFKAQKAVCNGKIEGEIHKLEALSPVIANRLLEAYIDSKSHICYKQKEEFPSRIEDTLLFRTAMLLLLKDKFSEDEYAEKKERYLKQSAHLFAVISKNEKVRREMMEDIEPLLYAKTKAFDLESDTQGLRENKYTHAKLNAQYWLTLESGAAGTKNVLNIEIMNRHFKIDLRGPLPFEEGYMPPAPASIKNRPDEEIYGRKLTLQEVAPGLAESDPPNAIYKKIFEIAMPTQLSAEIKTDLASKNMENARFLSTFSEEEMQGGCITNMFGRNLPRRLNEKSENSFAMKLIDAYPNYEKEAQEVQDYVRHKVAARIFTRLNSNLPYYIKRYTELLLESKA